MAGYSSPSFLLVASLSVIVIDFLHYGMQANFSFAMFVFFLLLLLINNQKKIDKNVLSIHCFLLVAFALSLVCLFVHEIG